MLAVVQQVLDEPRGSFALGVGLGEQLQVIGVGLVLAAVPIPPIAAGQIEPGRLVLVVQHQVLLDIPQDHRQLVLLALFFQGDAVHRQRVDRQLDPVAVEEIKHLGVLHGAVDEHHVDEGVGRRAMLFPAEPFGFVLDRRVFQQLHLLVLVAG